MELAMMAVRRRLTEPLESTAQAMNAEIKATI